MGFSHCDRSRQPLLLLALCVSCTVSLLIQPRSNREVEATKILDRHNQYRKCHQVPPLVADLRLKAEAQLLANALATDQMDLSEVRKLHHCNVFIKRWNRPLQDLFAGNEKSSFGINPVDKWYREIKSYHGDDKSRIAHFTRMVWKDSKKLGVGMAQNDKGYVYIVCKYDPEGNIPGSFVENVILPDEKMIYATDVCILPEMTSPTSRMRDTSAGPSARTFDAADDGPRPPSTPSSRSTSDAPATEYGRSEDDASPLPAGRPTAARPPASSTPAASSSATTRRAATTTSATSATTHTPIQGGRMTPGHAASAAATRQSPTADGVTASTATPATASPAITRPTETRATIPPPQFSPRQSSAPEFQFGHAATTTETASAVSALRSACNVSAAAGDDLSCLLPPPPPPPSPSPPTTTTTDADGGTTSDRGAYELDDQTDAGRGAEHGNGKLATKAERLHLTLIVVSLLISALSVATILLALFVLFKMFVCCSIRRASSRSQEPPSTPAAQTPSNAPPVCVIPMSGRCSPISPSLSRPASPVFQRTVLTKLY